MVEQSLWSWFSDMSLLSPQVAGLLNKASFPFLLALVSQVLAFKHQAAKPEFDNIYTGHGIHEGLHSLHFIFSPSGTP